MKIFYILFFLAVYSNFALSAQEAGKDNITEKGKDQDFITYNYNVMHCGKPLFPGGYSRFIELFRKHTHYSQAIADTLSEDIRVIARITLDSTGKIIKREAWCKYDFFEKDVLSFLNRLPDFEIPSQTESCCYKLNLGFIYKTYKLVPKCFSQDFKMYDEDTLYREKPQFPGGYKNFTNLLRQYTHYSKAIADSLPKSVNVLARIALDRTGKITNRYAWSESQLFRNRILHFLKNLPDFEGPSHIMDCDIQLNFTFEKYQTPSLKNPFVIYIFPQESREFEKYLKSVRDLDIHF